MMFLGWDNLEENEARDKDGRAETLNASAIP